MDSWHRLLEAFLFFFFFDWCLLLSHLTCRGGEDPARFIQEELQGPLETTTHDDEGEEGEVRSFHCKPPHPADQPFGLLF